MSIMFFLAGCKNSSHKSGIEENLNLGQRYLENGEYEEALIAFSKCIEIDPKCEPAYLGRAEAFGDLEQWEKGIEDCRAVMELNEENTKAYLVLGNLLLAGMEQDESMWADEYWFLMDLLQKKREEEAVGNLILRIEELAVANPSINPEEQSGAEENSLWNGKIQIVENMEEIDAADAVENKNELKLLYVLKKMDADDHFEIKKITVDKEPYYILIYYSQWEEAGYKGDGEYHGVLYEDGRIRSVLRGTEDANKVGDTGLNIDGQKVYDLDGNQILDADSRYELNWGFFHDLCRARDRDSSLFGYMNSKGEVVIPCIYENTKGFESGAAFSISDEGWGFINTQGQWLVDERYDFMGDETENGLYCVRDRETGKCGYVDVSGQFVIPCVYDKAFSFNGKSGDKNRRAIVFFEGKGTMIDDQGNDVLGEEYEVIASGYEYGLFPVKQKETGLYGYADRRGTIRIPCMYDEVLTSWAGDGAVKVRLGGEEYWVDFNNQKTEPVELSEEARYEWSYMMGGGQLAEADTYYVLDYKVYNWDGQVLLEGKEGSSIVVIDGTDFYYDDGAYIYVYRCEERDGI
ncbi:MAG: tetratricopeptide repeat protein [Hungatella sp.]|nr:tetratricopeptide repeat protein [Hungatella sp.]